MPEDVPVGYGRTGAALMAAFPGQYGEAADMAGPDDSTFAAPETIQQAPPFPPPGHPAQVPGNWQFPSVTPAAVHSHPDHGRQMQLTDIPGVGQVVVPVEHVAPNVGGISPEPVTMAGMGMPQNVETEVDHWHRVIAQHAAQAAHEVLSAAQDGRFATINEAEAFLAQRVNQIAAGFRASVTIVTQHVIALVMKRIAPVLKKAIRASAVRRRGVGDWRGSGFTGMGFTTYERGMKVKGAAPSYLPAAEVTAIEHGETLEGWRGSGFTGVGFPPGGCVQNQRAGVSGLSGLKASIAQMFGGADLDKLNRSISKLHDSVINSYNQLEALKKAEMEVAKLQGSVLLWVAGPFGTQLPTVAGIELLKAVKAINQGYSALTGFDYLARLIVQVFEPSAAEMKDVYSGIDGVIRALKLWNDTWIKQVSQKPGQGALWDSIQNEHNRLDTEAGVNPIDYDDPRNLQLAQVAVERMTKLPVTKNSGMGDFGITALIGVIIVAITLVSIVVAAVSLAKQFNVIANNVHEQRMAYEKRMEAQRKAYAVKRDAEGATAAQIQGEWTNIKAGEDKTQQAKEEKQKDVPSALDVGKYILPLVLVVGAAAIL